MNRFDWKKWAKYSIIGLLAVCLIFWVVIPAVEIIGINVLNFLFDYIQEHLFGVFIAACVLGFIVWCAYQRPTKGPEPERDVKPTMTDYETIVKTIYAATKNVSESLGLVPARSYADLYVDEADRILQWENVWGMKFKLHKQRSTTNFDKAFAMEVLQNEVESVMRKHNPSKLAKLYYPYGGVLKSTVQVADIDDGNAFVYIYVVLALTDTYFIQKANDERDDVAETEADTDDTDF